jgi:clan AA aspartic protease
MGSVYAEITLTNAKDVDAVQLGVMGEDEIRSVEVKALVDTGTWTLVINDELCRRLGLEHGVLWESTLADGSKHLYERMEPVRVHCENRDTICIPIMVPGADEVLLGAIPLQDMDLIVDLKNEKLIGRHGETPVIRV